MQGSRSDSQNLQLQQIYRQEYQRNEPEQILKLTQSSKKVKLDKPYRDIFRLGLEKQQEYHNGRIYFKWKNPYPIQLKYMDHVLNTLDLKQNCLVQAPTGSGKTLCLLNSVFGWLLNSSDTQRRKVIFTSRSHTQLQQLKKQILKTCYRPNMLIFAGRKKMCCNEKVNKIQNQEEIYNQCSKAVQYKRTMEKIKKMTINQQIKNDITPQYIKEVEQNMCKYFFQYPERKTPAYSINQSLSRQVIAIEDQYKANVDQGQCPYFYPGTVKYFPDLVLMPYNYVLNRRILSRNQKILENSIIIFDEGHNILQTAREGLTVSITLSEIEKVIDLMQKCKQKAEKRFEVRPQPADENNGSDDEQIKKKEDKPKVILKIQNEKQGEQVKKKQQKNIDQNKENKQEKNQKKQRYQKLIDSILSLRSKIVKISQNYKKFEQENFGVHSQDKILIQRGQNQRNIVETFIRIFFAKQLTEGSQFPSEQIQSYTKIFHSISFELDSIYNEIVILSHEHYHPVYLKKFGEKIKQMGSIVQNKPLLFNYGLFFQWIKVKQNSKSTASHLLEVKLYSFNPKLMFDILKKLPMSIIVTSGTLSPMDTWQVQSGVNFRQMPGNDEHVIKPQQCLTVFMPQYQGKDVYYSTGQNKQNIPQNSRRAMKAIKQICKGTPGGVLVILPSTAWITHIKVIFHESQIEKQPFFEEKNNQYMKNISIFQKTIKDACQPHKKGAIIFAKCRGQLTQGIDFADEMCRSVVIVGYPYPNMGDPYLKGKLDFFDRCKKADFSEINGEDWKQKQIIRAVNQGIGRVIRHKDDYGMIFLLDVRYKWSKIQKNISGWALRNKITIKKHEQIKFECEKFFQLQRDRLGQST